MTPRGLFLNTPKADSSIYESGVMIYDNLVRSDRYTLDYQEIDKNNRDIPDTYDFYAFNYHFRDMGWLDTKQIGRLPGLKLTFVLEVSPGNPFILLPGDDFDAYCVLDPTIDLPDKRVYAFPRALEAPPGLEPYANPEIPVIGTFGFLTRGKGYDQVVGAVSREFDKAVVRINIPEGKDVEPLWKRRFKMYLLRRSIEKVRNPGTEVRITEHYMTKPELIAWCSQNTLNCFLYDRDLPGLAATTDQCIVSGRPLAVSDNETFRHILKYIKPYPRRSLKESIAVSGAEVRKMQEDWSVGNFARRFEEVLEDFGLPGGHEIKLAGTGRIILPMVPDYLFYKRRVSIAAYWRYRQFVKVFQNAFRRKRS
jgi:hypothetical protein